MSAQILGSLLRDNLSVHLFIIEFWLLRELGYLNPKSDVWFANISPILWVIFSLC